MNHLHPLDYAIIFALFALYLLIGWIATRHSARSTEDFFLSGRNMPWWLLGISLVATTFSTDTPNLVTNLVRTRGVAGNWVWWPFLITGMVTVFLYARLWRRSGVLTDVEFYELRYSGRGGAWLRAFRAVWMGLIFNVTVLAAVTLAAIKIGAVMFGLSPWWTVLLAGGITLLYSAGGGLTAVLWTDFVQFTIAMIGSIAAACFALSDPRVGGLHSLLRHVPLQDKLSLFPDPTDPTALWSLLIIPLVVQWWAAWYPGAEPGGGSYVTQRMLAARNERHAVGATLLFNILHYALRPWPWIIVALCSLMIYPSLESLQQAFPLVPAGMVRDDLGYSAMLVAVLPVGWLGLVTASLIAAYMSTVSTHLNLGASYLVHDFYCRFLRPQCSEREALFAARLATVLLLVVAGLVALAMESALQMFQLFMLIGAGTGLIFLLRWFWWRINVWSELTAMVVSFAVALYWQFGHVRLGRALHVLNESGETIGQGTLQLWFGMPEWAHFPLTVLIVTACWIVVTLVTPPTDQATLLRFVERVRPGGPGWKHVLRQARSDGRELEGDAPHQDLPRGLLCAGLACMMVYGALFATGYLIYGNTGLGLGMGLATLSAAFALFRLGRGLNFRD